MRTQSPIYQIIKEKYTLKKQLPIVIGIGTGGINAIKQIFRSYNDEVYCIALTTDIEDILNCTITHKYIIDPDTFQVRNLLNSISEQMQPENFLIVACMGGKFTAEFSPVLAKQILFEFGELPNAIVTLPFQFEGPVRLNRALRDTQLLLACCNQLRVLPNETIMKEIRKRDNRSITLTQAYEISDFTITKELLTLL